MTTAVRHVTRTTALAAACSLALVGGVTLGSPANAATAGITIARTGYVPANQTIAVGDTITFTNADTDPHQVVFKQTTGFTCTATPLVIAPTKSQSCTFTAADAYTYSDPNQNGNAFRGTITVQAAPAVTLAPDSGVVVYGTKVTVSGKVSPSSAGTSVDIMAQATDESAFTKVASAVTTASGAYSAVVTPEIATTYRADAQVNGSKISSSTQVVQVRPNVTLALRSVRNHRANFQSKVISSIEYAGKTLKVQRQNRLGGWTTLRTVTIGSFSTVRFRVVLPSGISRFRTMITTAQAGAGYLGNSSNIVAVKR